MKCKDTCCFECKHQVDSKMALCPKEVFQCHGPIAESDCLAKGGGVCEKFERKDV